MKCILFILGIAISLTQGSCKANKEKENDTGPSVKKVKISKPVVKKAPIINIIDTVEIKRNLLCVKDSAATNEILIAKLTDIFTNKLPAVISAGKLKIMGAPVVWYQSKKAPYFFQAGLPVDKAPVKISKGLFMMKTGSDSAYLAHFFGPNELTGLGYDALTDMLKENKKRKTSSAYEIYIDNKFLEGNKKKDPYKLQTDIVMPFKK